MSDDRHELESLHIYRHGASGKPIYNMTATFTGYGNKVELKLDDSLGMEIVQLCMTRIAGAIHAAAANALEAMGEAASHLIEEAEEVKKLDESEKPTESEELDTSNTFDLKTDESPDDDDEIPF